MIKQNITIFYVSDQEAAKTFYEAVLSETPSIHVPGMTEFKLGKNASLGLMPLNGIKKLVGQEFFQKETQANPKAELYLKVDNCQLYLDRAVQAGAKLILPIQKQNWGDLVGYCLTVDDHVLAFAEDLN